MRALDKWEGNPVDNLPVDNYPFHTQLIRQRSTG